MTKKIKSILLVDDDPDDQFLFQEALLDVDNSISCLNSFNGIDALEKLNSEAFTPDLIFMDVNMPKMSGIECLKELQKNEKLSFLPVFMYSTSCSDGYQKECFINGAVGYIEKPNDFFELCNKLKTILVMDFKKDMPVTL